MTPAQKKAYNDYMKSLEDYKDGGAPEYQQGEDLKYQDLNPDDLASLGQSDMAKITTNPRYKDAQLEALRSIEERSKNGMTAQDEADMYKLHRNVSTENRGRMGAIQNNMAARGMSGSGMDAMMQLQASQDATDREALAAMEKAGQIQNNKMNASESLGRMGGQMRSQDFGEQTARAQAADSIARFNAATRNQALSQNNQGRNDAAQSNWARGNQTSDNNVSGAYDNRKTNLSASQSAAQFGYNAATEDENARRIREAERYRRKNAWKGMLGAVIGGGAAAYGSGGNPQATAAGTQVGMAAGNASYAYGGDVHSKWGNHNVPYPGEDNPANDVVKANLTPGEHVVPVSAMSSEAAFNDYTNRLRESIKAKQTAADEAKSGQEMAEYGSIFTSLLNDYNKNNRKDVVLGNSFQNLGQAPTIIRGETREVQDFASPMAKANLDRAEKELARGKDEFAQQEELKQVFKNRGRQDVQYDREEKIRKQEEDSGSEISKVYQALATKMMPKKDFSNYSAMQLKQTVPSLEKMYAIDQQKKEQTRGQIGRFRKDSDGRLYDSVTGEYTDSGVITQDGNPGGQIGAQEKPLTRRPGESDSEFKGRIATNEKNKVAITEIETRRTNIDANIDKAIAMIKDKGTFEMIGSHNQDLDAILEEVATDMAKLQDPTSVARPSEVENIKKNLVSSGVFGNKNSTAVDILTNFKGRVGQKVQDAYKVRGITPVTEPVATEPTVMSGKDLP